MLRLAQLFGWPLFKVKRSKLLGSKWFNFSCFFEVFEFFVFRFFKNDEGILLDKITCNDHFLSCLFWYYKHKQAK